jgi:ATP-dependent Clp protease ATP-binding subunit ClpA
MSSVELQPFDRFSDDAKRVLDLTQEEAEIDGHGYIGTEHLLLAILADGQNVGARALREMGVAFEQVRAALAALSGRPEPKPDTQPQPTERTKRVIEIAFQQAMAIGHNYLGPEHLLLGLVVEAEGVAARVLRDLGVTPERTWVEVTRLLAVPGVVAAQESTVTAAKPYLSPARFSPEANAALRAAHHLAKAEGADEVQLEHLLRALKERSRG